MDDVRAVMDAAGSERAALFGLSEGGPMSVLFAATYPERTRALDPVRHRSRPESMTPHENPGGQRWVDRIRTVRAAAEHWGEGRTLALHGAERRQRARAHRARHLRALRGQSDRWPETLIQMVIETDVRDLLPSIRVPTLVLHRAEEFIPVENARYLAEHIPGARLVVLPGMDHIPFYGDADGYAEEIEEFLTGARHAPVSDRVLTTVMFTDIVGSTERAAVARRRPLARADVSPRRAHASRARAPPGSRGQDDG